MPVKTPSAPRGSSELPVTVVIDREGFVHEVIIGIILPDEFEQKIKLLLQ